MDPAPSEACDWAAVARDFRLGQLSLAELAETYGLSLSALRRRVKAEGWTRAPDEGGLRLAAERGLAVAREHRRLLGDLRQTLAQVQGALRDHLERPPGNDPETGTEGGAPAAPLGGRAETVAGLVRALGATAEKLIAMERRAFGLDRADEGEDDGDRATIRDRLAGRLARLALAGDAQPLPGRPERE